ncbi:hypothetical protein EXIGUO8H_100012 [Exiguobacterium sp. 8H]|uniref:hypothetical protein n=1 Tax=Exiguobacterium sp. 8H TaxID=2653140 RepID=UPI0012EF9CEC|nr:hypothetical protein [Exiguobacterium sp. 8H]VXB37762.1 hypothetical protein EXIGUO8H_100012 [Exiguobacterium sp. 8H]
MSVANLTSEQEMDVDRIKHELKDEGVDLTDWNLYSVEETGDVRNYVFLHPNDEDDIQVSVDDYVVFNITGSGIPESQPSIKKLIRTIIKTTVDLSKDERKFRATLLRNHAVYWDVLNEMDIHLSLLDHFEPNEYETKEELAKGIVESLGESSEEREVAERLHAYIENWWWVKGMHLVLDFIVKEGIDMTGWVNIGDKSDLSRGDYRFYHPFTEEEFEISCGEENAYKPTPQYLEDSVISVPCVKEAKTIREAIELNLAFRDHPIGRERMNQDRESDDDRQTVDMKRIIKQFETEGFDTTRYKLHEIAETDGRTMYFIGSDDFNYEVTMVSTDSGKFAPHYYRNNGFERYELAEADSIVEAIERREEYVQFLKLRDIRYESTCLSPEQQRDMERVLEVLEAERKNIDLDLWALQGFEEEDGIRQYFLIHENGEDDLLATVNRDGNCTVRDVPIVPTESDAYISHIPLEEVPILCDYRMDDVKDGIVSVKEVETGEMDRLLQLIEVASIDTAGLVLSEISKGVDYTVYILIRSDQQKIRLCL